jgi:molybdopterin/thiamine biosynthesis adenylyltransferase
MRLAAAMDGAVGDALEEHLLRGDGQEDLCFGVWSPSTGNERTTSIVRAPLLPRDGERHVHGNASFEPGYVLRAAQAAAAAGGGLAFMHSHPAGGGWQGMSGPDKVAEGRVANLAREITGLPLVGLTLAGDRSWSARVWAGVGQAVTPRWCESVRVIRDRYLISFNRALMPVPEVAETQVRTVHTWGEEIQARIAQLRTAVVGAGSVGIIVAEALARTGVQRIGVFDFDTVELLNLDRLRGATRLDAALRRPKAHVVRCLLEEASTARRADHEFFELSVCEREGMKRVLDYDIVFSCVDRPWPRHVLTTVAFADLIPVIDGGLRAFRNTDGSLRNAYWRSSLVRPGRPCLACLGQYDPALVQVERDGSLDDESYIAGLPADSPLRRRENVAAFSTSVAAALLEQFVSYVAQPSGSGDPGPLRFSLRDASVTRDSTTCETGCEYQASAGVGDGRLDPSAAHAAAERARAERGAVPRRVRLARHADDALHAARRALGRVMER